MTRKHSHKNRSTLAILFAFLFFGSIMLGGIVYGQSPGGVGTNLDIWLKADAGITTSGSNVTNWANQSAGPNITVGGSPDFNANAQNFNPVVDFTLSNGASNGGDFLSVGNTLTDPTSRFYQSFFWSAKLNDLTRTYTHLGTNHDVSGLVPVQGTLHGGVSGSAAAYQLAGYDTNFEAVGVWQQNGLSVPFSEPHSGDFDIVSAIGTGITDVNRFYGGQSFASGGTVDLPQRDWFGPVGELIVYTTALSVTDRLKVQSYLALKYGVTLDQTTAQDYVASDGTTEMWDKDATGASTYDNDIVGVGRDDNSALGQVKSKSANDDAIVIIEAESEGTNAVNSFVDIADLEFLTFGNNDGAATWTATGAPLDYKILSRQWSVQETGEVGTIQLDIDVADTGFNVPALISGNNYYFIYDGDNDDDLSDETPTAMTDQGGDVWRITGIDLEEGMEFALASRIDTDSDGIPNVSDLDDDNDGISDVSESLGTDTDGDGIADRLDLDSDNDGISDLVESGADYTALDPDNNGVIDGAQFIDTDTDGLSDAIETTNGADTGTTPTSTDGDSIPDYLDLDSDGDALPDAIEAQATMGYAASFANDGDVTDDDSDGDGALDIHDGVAGHGGAFNVPQNTDGADNLDYLDLDSDNDGRTDNVENGSDITTAPTYLDPNGNMDDPTTMTNAQNPATAEVDYREVVTSVITNRRITYRVKPN